MIAIYKDVGLPGGSDRHRLLEPESVRFGRAMGAVSAVLGSVQQADRVATLEGTDLWVQGSGVQVLVAYQHLDDSDHRHRPARVGWRTYSEDCAGSLAPRMVFPMMLEADGPSLGDGTWTARISSLTDGEPPPFGRSSEHNLEQFGYVAGNRMLRHAVELARRTATAYLSDRGGLQVTY